MVRLKIKIFGTTSWKYMLRFEGTLCCKVKNSRFSELQEKTPSGSTLWISIADGRSHLASSKECSTPCFNGHGNMIRFQQQFPGNLRGLMGLSTVNPGSSTWMLHLKIRRGRRADVERQEGCYLALEW